MDVSCVIMCHQHDFWFVFDFSFVDDLMDVWIVTKARHEVGKMRWLRKKNLWHSDSVRPRQPQHGNTFQGTITYPTSGKGKSGTQKCRLVGNMFPRRLQHFFIAVLEGFGRSRHADSSHRFNKSILDAFSRTNDSMVHVKRFSLENLSDPKSKNPWDVRFFFPGGPIRPKKNFRTNDKFCKHDPARIYSYVSFHGLFFPYALKNERLGTWDFHPVFSQGKSSSNFQTFMTLPSPWFFRDP